jgi:hypothetical protein
VKPGELLVALAILGACGGDRPAARATAATDSIAVKSAPLDSQSTHAVAPPPAVATADSIPANFVAAADSVLQLRLAQQMFVADPRRAVPLEECNMMDEGLAPAFAATRVRVLHDVASRPRWETDPSTKARSLYASFTIEITSVAALHQVDGAQLEQRYDVTVAPRIDTAEADVFRHETSGRWDVCEPLRYRDGIPLEPWTFVQASDTAIRTEKWTPASMNWASLTQLARDSSAVH